MIKTVEIEGKQITFKSTGGTMIRYRNEFNSEMLTDITKLQEAQTDTNAFSIMPFLQVIWTLAKTADSTIPDMQTWYDSFDSFPVFDVWKDLESLVTSSLQTLYPKNAQTAAT